MLLKDRVWKSCPTCGSNRELVSEEVFGCDQCHKKTSDEVLQVNVFFKNDVTDNYHFCSWACVLKKLKRLKSDYFIDLPLLHFDGAPKGQRPVDFWKAIKEFGK